MPMAEGGTEAERGSLGEDYRRGDVGVIGRYGDMSHTPISPRASGAASNEFGSR